MRAMLGHWAGCGLPLPQAKSPLTIARLVILFGPEPHCQGSGAFVLGVGWVVGMGGRIAGCAHCLEKSAPIFAGASIHRLIKETLRRIARTRD
jgi:hypothetical protein